MYLISKDSEFIRFVFVGIIATATHYGMYLLMMKWFPTNIAYTIGYVLSFCCNFLLTNVFTFRTKPNAKKGLGFAFSHIINYGLHVLLLNLFIYLGLSKQIAPIFVYAIAVPTNFLLLKFIFKSKWAAL